MFLFKKGVSIIWILLSLFYVVPLEASPIGFYVRGGSVFYIDAQSAEEELVGFMGFGWQPRPTLLLESVWTSSWMTLKSDDSGKNMITVVWKDIVPLKYYLNCYKQIGISWKNELGLCEAFLGLGIMFYPKSSFYIDCSFRNYTLFNKFSEKDVDNLKKNSLVLGCGYYIR